MRDEHPADPLHEGVNGASVGLGEAYKLMLVGSLKRGDNLPVNR